MFYFYLFIYSLLGSMMRIAVLYGCKISPQDTHALRWPFRLLLVSQKSHARPSHASTPVAVLACIVEVSIVFRREASPPPPPWHPATPLGSAQNGFWPPLRWSGDVILMHCTVCVCHDALASLLHLAKGAKSTDNSDARAFCGGHVNIWPFDPQAK